MLPSFLTAICFALTAVSARQSASLIGPLRANVYRLLLAALILGLISLVWWKGMLSTSLWELALAGGIGFGLGGYCMMQTLRRMGSPRALLAVESGTAVLAGLFAWIVLDDRLSVQQILSCGIILSGVLFAGSQWIKEARESRQGSGGYAYAVAAALFQAASLVLSRHVFLMAAGLSQDIDKFNAAFIRLLGGLLIAILLIGLNTLRIKNRLKSERGEYFRLLRRGESLRQQPIIWVFANALFGPVLGVTCWLWAVSLINPGIVQSIAATAPLISIPIARMLESHPLGIRFYIGAPVAIMGIASLMLW